MKTALSRPARGVACALVLGGFLFAVFFPAGFTARADPSGPPPERPLPVPPAWLKFDVEWKATWDETLQAHPENKWQAELQKDPSTAPHAEMIGRLRRIELLKAMMQRWPDDKARHADACSLIAASYDKLGWPWWRSWWGYAMATKLSGDPQAVQQGYQLALNNAFNAHDYFMVPENKDWEFVIYEVIRKHKAGQLPDCPVVRSAYSHLGRLIADFVDYQQAQPFMEDLRNLAKKDAGYGAEVTSLLQQFGHNQGGARPGSAITRSSSAQEALFELQTRWEAVQHTDFFEDGAAPVDGKTLQRLFDLIVETEASAPDSSDRTPYWTLLDKRLTTMPRERVAAFARAQDEAASLAAATAKKTGDGDELLRAFRRYPLAACIHEALVELAERDIRRGLSQWAVPVLWSVSAHTGSSELRAQAYAALWVALSQDPADRSELERAMQAVADDTPIAWLGGTAQAAAIKKTLLTQAPQQEAPKIALENLVVRRIELPGEWPAQEHSPEGPLADYGSHSPWPVSWIDRCGDSVVVGSPTAVARLDAGQSAPAWVLAPAADAGAWEWFYHTSRGQLAFEQSRNGRAGWTSGRRPVRTAGNGCANGRAYCLMTHIEPAVVAAVDVFEGKLLWTTEAGHNWEGMEPLSHPAEAEGRLYVMAAPPDKRTKNWLPYPRTEPTTISLICLDADNGHVLWKRPVATLQEVRLDMARGSGRVVVREGRVYCVFNAGVIARCGAHDGVVQWIQHYSPAVHNNGNLLSINHRREGAGPIIAVPTGAGQTGPIIVLAPRDHSGVIAFSHESGKILWETPLVPSDKILGATGREVVSINERWLSALDLATGKPMYCREFRDGTGNTGLLVGSDVILVSGGVLYRLQASSGEVIETRDLKTGPGAEFAILADRTVLQIVPPPLATMPPQPTAGRQVALPLEKVWSVQCESPRLLLEENRAGVPRTFGLVSGRRMACVSSEPTWGLKWQGLLPRPPQAAAFTGNNILTSDRQTLAAHNADDGKTRWTKDLPFAPTTVGGDDRVAYFTTGHKAVGRTFGVFDSVTGEPKWMRHLGRESFDGSESNVLRTEADGTRVLRLLTWYRDPATWQRPFGEAQIDAATGKILRLVPLMAPECGLWSTLTYDEKGAGWIRLKGQSYWGFGEQSVLAADYSGKVLADNWKRRFDMLSVAHYCTGRTGVHIRGGGVYARMNGYILFYDPAAGREVTYALANDHPEQLPPFVFDFREHGDRLIVVSGVVGMNLDWNKAKLPRSDPSTWKMHVEVFERATGKSLGRQELPGVKCCVSFLDHTDMAGYETQACITDNSIIVTDYNGVYVFGSPNA